MNTTRSSTSREETLESISTELSDRMLDPLAVDAAARAGVEGPLGVVWDGWSLGSGLAGIALFQLARASRCGDDELLSTAFDHLRHAVRINNASPSGALGLMSGASGLAVVLNECARQEARFRPSARRMHDRIVDATLETSWDFAVTGVPVPSVDVISGIAGLARYFATTPWGGARTRVALDHVVHYLSWLVSRDVPVTRTFFNDPETYLPGSIDARQFPHGHVELGAAHGLAGMLHALAESARSGRTSIDVSEAMSRLLDVVHGPQSLDSGKSVVFLVPSEDGDTRPDERAPGRLGWCRGAIGLWLAVRDAAHVLDDDGLGREAEHALNASAHALATERSDDPFLCHGVGAALAVAVGDGARSSATADAALATIADLRLPALPFLFAPPAAGTGPRDVDPSFLSGAAGVGAAAELALGSPIDWTTPLGMT
ncbi:lanthionine synthetase LanC family protein [Oerskovia sp. KBS0722]|uniref:lanthionine synthetase LanC family protein n=1 Tax=Oerskovia sp. KBS0722 TaxID=1179673 RepID=UPI00110D58C7|nr:lanthionine synthetase LanC family protein [Oerskovia sp. KBS0722]QDW63976.1 hypothetical protein FFI11_016970 [Oerskovia sp. KBS0722]